MSSDQSPPARPDRKGKHLVAAHFTEESVIALQRAALRLREETAEAYGTAGRVTTHDLLAAGSALLLRQLGEPIPIELADTLLKFPSLVVSRDLTRLKTVTPKPRDPSDPH